MSLPRFPLILAAAALTAALATPASAEGLLSAPSAWRFLGAPGEKEAEFVFQEDALAVSADGAVGFLYRPAAGAPTLSWRWRVDRPIPPSDQAREGADDRAIAVHLWVDTGRREELAFGPLARLYGYPTVTHLLTYVWGGVREPEALVANPYYERGAVMVVRSSAEPSGRWAMERRDLAADLARAFGDAVRVEHIKYLAVSADTDQRGGDSRARIADLRFEEDRP